jgi:GntR family transcriptional regulator, transcriptional repressor for pyruvate dehydrogenase complex
MARAPQTGERPAFIRPVERRRAFEEILDRLEEAIADGQLAAGDRLPPERELAAGFGVSRTTVREALRVLETLGLVDVRRGADYGVTLRREPGNALAHALRFQLALRHLSADSLIEFRAAVESWAVRVAAIGAQEPLLAELDAPLVQMERDDLGQHEFHELDAAFHMGLVRASGNELAVLVLEGARGAIQRAMLEAILKVDDWPATRARLVREHRGIADAVRARDPDTAARRVESHIRRFYVEHVG